MATSGDRDMAIDTWSAGDVAQCDLWFPPRKILLEDGSRTLGPARQGPALDLHRTQRRGGVGSVRGARGERGKAIPAIPKLWPAAWEEFTPFLAYDVEIRQVLLSTNAIESLNARYRRAVGNEVTSPPSRPRSRRST